MPQVAEMLSKIFFLNELSLPLIFEWKRKLYEGKEDITTFGDSAHMRQDKVHIRVDPDDHTAVKGFREHSTAILSTFIHELIHGYFFSFCCEGAEAHDKRTGSCHREGRMIWPRPGGNGHCFGWFLVACKIDICMEELIGVKGHCFSFRSLIYHCNEGGKISAGDWLLFFYLFTWEEINEMFCYLRNTSGKNERRDLHRLLMKDGAAAKVWVDLSSGKR